MHSELRFIHAADVHLGAPFKGLHPLPSEWEATVANAIPQAFGQMVDAAIQNKVDFVALAGDLFDQAGPSYYEYCLAMDGLNRLDAAGIPVYFCAGNHDPFVFWDLYYGAMPKNVHVFPSGEDGGFFLHERDGEPLALLAGRGYCQRFWPYGHDIAKGLTREAAREALGADAPFAVGVLHAGLHIDPLKAPLPPEELLESGMDYWALGHIHSRYVDDPANPRIAFSGCVQARAAKNEGPHGVNLVTLRKGQPNTLEFIPTAQVVWWRPRIDVSACETLDEILQNVGDELDRLHGESPSQKMLVRITLRGSTLLHEQLRGNGILEWLRLRVNEARPWCYCEHLADETRAFSDRSALAAEGLFAASFLECSQQAAQNRPAEISALQSQLVSYGIEPENMSMGELDKWEKQARQLVLDMLAEGSGAHGA